MVRLSSSPGARIASHRSLSTSRPTTPGCAASHHLKRGALPAPPGVSGSAPARAAGLGGRPWSPRSWKVGPGGRSPGCAAACHEWSGSEDPGSGTGSTVRVHECGHKTIRRSAQGVPPRPARSAGSREAAGTRRTPVRAPSRTPQIDPSRTAQGNHAGSLGPAQRLPERPDETSTRASASEPPRGTAGRDPHQGSTAHARGRRPSSSDTRSEASRITCETRAEGRPREPTAWGRGARGRFMVHPVSPESCGKVPIDRGDAFSRPHRGRLIGLDT